MRAAASEVVERGISAARYAALATMDDGPSARVRAVRSPEQIGTVQRGRPKPGLGPSLAPRSGSRVAQLRDEDRLRPQIPSADKSSFPSRIGGHQK